MTPATPHDPRCAIVRTGNSRAWCDCQLGHLYEALDDLWNWVDYTLPSEIVNNPEWPDTADRIRKALQWQKVI